MTAFILFASAVVLLVGLKLCFASSGESRAERAAAPPTPSSPYVRYVRAVQAETNRIFAFAQKVCVDHEARRILDDQVNVTGQVDSGVR